MLTRSLRGGPLSAALALTASSLLALGLALSSGCNACRPVPNEPEGATLLSKRYSSSLRPRPITLTASPEELERTLQTPIVDIHVHTFNARYLPIQNILLGKRDVNFFAMFLHSRWARRIAAAITGATRLTKIDSLDGESLATQGDPSFETLCRASLGGTPEEQAAAFENECVIALQGIRETLDVGDEAIELAREHGEIVDEEAAREARLDLLALTLGEGLHGGPLKDLKKAMGQFGFLADGPIVKQFLVSMIALDGDLPALFHRSFEHRVSLMVSHTMDLAPVYDQEEDGQVLIPFEEQVERIAHFQDDPSSKMLYFVAYNPFRDNDGNGGEALRIVKDAIENKGAYGVKIYPPSGYRPSHNIIPKRPRALFTDEPEGQFDARYSGVEAEELDSRLLELFRYCVQEDLPIFAHCLDGEFEARKGYAACFADPRWWRPILEMQEFRSLRLCFGHAGSDEFWFGRDGEREDWGSLVYELCVEFENVYCGFGVHGDILERDGREHFVELLSRLIEDGKGRFPIETKVIYGSDWYMPNGTDHAVDYLRGYQVAFMDGRLLPHYGRFFCRNALDFLDAPERAEDPRLPLHIRSLLEGLLDSGGLHE